MSRPALPLPGPARPSARTRAVARDAEFWVARLASREITPRQLRRFEAWVEAHSSHREAFDRTRALWLAVGRLDPEGGAPFQAGPRKRPGKAFAAVRRAGPVAAAVLISAGTAAFAAEHWTAWTSDVAAGEETWTERLPDGSLVVLDAGAALDLAYTPGQRTVRLKQGQAWFSVRPDPARPFVVETGSLTARAGGSDYAVRRGPDGDQVTVTGGQVAVAGPGDASAVMVAAGTTRDYSAGRPTTRAARDAATAWRDGRLVLEDLTVGEAVAEIDRYRPGRLIVLEAPDRPVNAALFLKDLDRGLGGLADSQNLKLTRVLPGVTVVTVREAPGG